MHACTYRMLSTLFIAIAGAAVLLTGAGHAPAPQPNTPLTRPAEPGHAGAPVHVQQDEPGHDALASLTVRGIP